MIIMNQLFDACIKNQINLVELLLCEVPHITISDKNYEYNNYAEKTLIFSYNNFAF